MPWGNPVHIVRVEWELLRFVCTFPAPRGTGKLIIISSQVELGALPHRKLRRETSYSIWEMDMHVSLHEKDGQSSSYPWMDRPFWLQHEDWTGTAWGESGEQEHLGSKVQACNDEP